MKFFFFIPVTIVLSSIYPFSQAESDLTKPIIEREVQIQIPAGAVMQPRVASLTGGGTFIVAGNIQATRQGWATEITADGQVRWNYYRDVQPNDNAWFAKRIVGPVYAGAVSLTDGGVILCGNMPRPPPNRRTGLITFLDPNGQLLWDRLIAGSRGTLFLDACVRWGGRVAIVGQDDGVTGTVSPHPKAWYRVLLLTNTGKVLWDKLIPSHVNRFFPDPEGTVAIPDGDNLIISTTDNVKSELISIDLSGNVTAQKALEGRFLLIRPVHQDRLLQIFGSHIDPSNDSQPNNTSHDVITINKKLDFEGMVRGDVPSNFAPRIVYRMPDQSLVLFGSSVHRSGDPLRSAIVHVSRELKQEKSIDLARRGFFDGGSIWAATPTLKIGKFFVARLLSEKWDGPFSSEPNNLYRGAVIDFVQLK